MPTLDDAFARIRERGTAAQDSYVCLITGSSRTADIEKILVMGAHGPRRLVVIVELATKSFVPGRLKGTSLHAHALEQASALKIRELAFSQ